MRTLLGGGHTLSANLTPNPNPNLDCEGVALDGELDRLGTLREAEPVQAKARTYMSSRPAWDLPARPGFEARVWHTEPSCHRGRRVGRHVPLELMAPSVVAQHLQPAERHVEDGPPACA